MAVMARDVWTDERLDDLNKRVDEGFTETRDEFRALRSDVRDEFQAVRGEMKGEFQALRGEMKSEFQAVRSEMKGEFQAVRGEISALQRTTFQLFAGVMVTLALGFGGMIVALLTQT